MRLFETLAVRPPYHIQGIAGGSQDLVIAFASVGHDPTRPPSPEFVRAATAASCSDDCTLSMASLMRAF